MKECLTSFMSYPQKRVQCSILHKLCHNHHRPTLSDHPLQADNVGVVELPHDGGLRQEVSPLPISVAHFEGFDGYNDLPPSGQLESSAANFPKLSCESRGETDGTKAKEDREKVEGGEGDDGRVEESGGKKREDRRDS